MDEDKFIIRSYQDKDFKTPDIELTEQEYNLIHHSHVNDQVIQFRNKTGIVEFMKHQVAPFQKKELMVYFELTKQK